jgi:hypothetical protein
MCPLGVNLIGFFPPNKEKCLELPEMARKWIFCYPPSQTCAAAEIISWCHPGISRGLHCRVNWSWVMRAQAAERKKEEKEWWRGWTQIPKKPWWLQVNWIFRKCWRTKQVEVLDADDDTDVMSRFSSTEYESSQKNNARVVETMTVMCKLWRCIKGRTAVKFWNCEKPGEKEQVNVTVRLIIVWWKGRLSWR